MAKILLNVEVVESKNFQAKLQEIREKVDKTFNGGDNGNSMGGVKAARTQVESLQKSFANLLNTLKGSESKYAPKTFDALKASITKCLNETKELNEAIGDNKPTEEQSKAYSKLKKQLSTLSAEFSTARVESEKLQKENKLAIPNVDNLRKKYANLFNTIKGAEKYYKKGTFDGLTSRIKDNLDSLRNLNPTTEEYATTVNNLDKELNELSRQFAETKASSENMHGSFTEIVKGFLKFQLAAMVVMKPLQLIRQGWEDLNETLVETEDAVVALRRVAGEAANANELYDLAQRYGQTFENVNDIATNFARAGYDWNETIQATEAALLALNTAELDAAQASDGMIAILQQFGYEASELEGVIDKLNITADNAAVSTDKLLTALQRTGSSAKNANLSLEQTVGIITALSEATGRSGENLGTAINSLIQFSTKSSSLDTFAKLGGNVEEVVERYRQGGATVLEIWQALSEVIKSNADYTESVLGKTFTTEEFEALNEETKQALGESFAQTTEIYNTASTFRKNYFIALLQNLDQVQESLDTMQGAQGYSQKENLQYLDTYTARVNALEAKWQDIANDEQGLLGIKKGLVDIASGLLDALDFIGGIQTILVGLVISTLPSLVSLLGKALTALQGMVTAATGVQIAFGALAVVGMIISGIVSAVQDYNEEQERQRDIAIASFEANKANADTLEQLYEKYKKLTPADDEFLTVQKDLVTALGDKATALEGLTVGSEEYTKAVEAMTEAELEYYRTQQRTAATASKEKLGGFSFSNYNYSVTNKGLNELLRGKGVEFKDNWYVKTTGNTLKDYEIFSNATGIINEEYNRLIREGNFEEANKLTESDFYKYAQQGIGASQGLINDYLRTNTSKLLSDYEISRGTKVDTQEEFDEALKFIIENLGTSDFYDDMVKGFLSSFVKLEKEKPSGSGDGGSTETTDLKDVVDKLEQIRDNTQKTKDLEEKMLALEEARNQRTVRVYNAETGQWEMQVNEKAVAQAEKSLKDTAMDNILSYLSTDEAQEKLETGEFTLPDWLTAMIASPTGNDAFQAFMTSMGILSGAVNKTPMSSGAVVNSNASTTNNDSRTYTINGVPISKEDAERYTPAELFEMYNITG